MFCSLAAPSTQHRVWHTAEVNICSMTALRRELKAALRGTTLHRSMWGPRAGSVNTSVPWELVSNCAIPGPSGPAESESAF